jgi:hypothetical protein
MSLLSMIARVANAPGVGIAAPAAVVGSGDVSVIELLELANQEGEELARRADWPVLTAEHSFTTSAAPVQAGALPGDFDRFVNGTWWNRTTNRRLVGPLSPQQWQAQQATAAGGPLSTAFRLRGADLLITPVPPAGQTVAYEYVSRNWCRSALGAGQSAWAADMDAGILDERLMALGIIWRWRKAKGLAYGEAFDAYEMEAEKAAARAGGAPVLSLSGAGPVRAGHVPDGSWG